MLLTGRSPAVWRWRLPAGAAAGPDGGPGGGLARRQRVLHRRGRGRRRRAGGAPRGA